MNNRKTILHLCEDLRDIQSDLKSLKEEARIKLSELEDKPREYRRQMTKATHLTNAEQNVIATLEYLKELC